MVAIKTDPKTAQVLSSIKSGERSVKEYQTSRAKLASQGVNVTLIDGLLRKKGMLGPQVKEDAIPFLPEGAERFLAESKTLPTVGMIGGELLGLGMGGGLASLATGPIGAGIGGGGGEGLRQTLRAKKGYQEKIEPKEMLGEGATGGITSLLGGAIGPLIAAPAKFLGKAAAQQTYKGFERLAQRPIRTLLASGAKKPLEMGRKLVSSLDELGRMAAKGVRKETEVLAKEGSKFLNTTGLAKKLEKEVGFLNRVPELPQVTGMEKEVTDKLIGILKNPKLPLNVAQGVVDYFDDIIMYGKGAMKPLQESSLNSAMKSIRGELSGQVKKIAPKFGEAVSKSRELIHLEKGFRQRLRDEFGSRAEKFVKSINLLGEGDRQAIEKLAKLVPAEHAFWDKLMDVAAGSEFKKIPPGFMRATVALLGKGAGILGLPATMTGKAVLSIPSRQAVKNVREEGLPDLSGK